jgi:hypothetical protein
MGKLSKNWLTEPCIDFEYKKYILLAYWQKVEASLSQNKLFPFYTDLIAHYSSLIALRQTKQGLNHQFSKELEGMDLQQLQLLYKEFYSDTPSLEEINAIIDYSIPIFNDYIHETEQLKYEIMQRMELLPIGLAPIYQREGYLLLCDQNKIKVHEYRLNMIEHVNRSQYSSVTTTCIKEYVASYSNTFENIKLDLIQTNKKFPNPATYAITLEVEVPYQETLLPIAEEILTAYITGY